MVTCPSGHPGNSGTASGGSLCTSFKNWVYRAQVLSTYFTGHKLCGIRLRDVSNLKTEACVCPVATQLSQQGPQADILTACLVFWMKSMMLIRKHYQGQKPERGGGTGRKRAREGVKERERERRGEGGRGERDYERLNGCQGLWLCPLDCIHPQPSVLLLHKALASYMKDRHCHFVQHNVTDTSILCVYHMRLMPFFF